MFNGLAMGMAYFQNYVHIRENMRNESQKLELDNLFRRSIGKISATTNEYSNTMNEILYVKNACPLEVVKEAAMTSIEQYIEMTMDMVNFLKEKTA